MTLLQPHFEAFLDIETTGLSFRYSEITVIGIHLHNLVTGQFVQLVGKDITADNILNLLRGVDVIYTYNGSRFDLPFISYHLGIDLAQVFKHHDLMYDCWRNGLKGGLKRVECQLGIERSLRGISGCDAVRLWRKYIDECNKDALRLLLFYNKEDVLNLRILKQMLL